MRLRLCLPTERAPRAYRGALKMTPRLAAWDRKPFLGAGEGARAELTFGLGNRATGKGALWELHSVLVDTGADRSGVPEEAVAEIERHVGRLKKTERPVLTGAGLARVTMLDDVRICVGLPGNKNPKGSRPAFGPAACCAETSLLVIPQLQSSLLLGRDLLMPCRASIDFERGELCLKDTCAKLEGL